MTSVSDGSPVFAVDVGRRAEDLGVSGERVLLKSRMGRQMAVITVEHLTKRYGQLTPSTNVSLVSGSLGINHREGFSVG